jgi:beta-glucosidase
VVGGTVQNSGGVAGAAVMQVYVSPADWQAAGWEAPKRLVAFHKAELTPGGSAAFSQKVDPKLLATYDEATDSWVIKGGVYHVLLGQASDDLPQSVDITLPDSRWSAAH